MKTMKYIYTITALLFATLQTFAQTYEYDDNNRLTKVTYPNGVTVSYTYDVLGNRLSKTVTGGEETNDSTFKATTAEGVEVTYKIINEEEKTCQVFAANSQTPAIDASTTGSVTIPAEVNGYKVTSIGVNAFKNCQELTKVILPESVTIINTDAFAGCVKLAEIIFPSKVSDFNQHIFDDTPWYANQPDGPLYINNLLYTYKGEMPENTVINVPEGCTSISNMAFASQVNLKGIELPTSLERIGYQAFLSSGIKEIIIPANCAMIYMRAFKDCGSLEEVTFLGKTGMGAGVFSKCPNLKTITVNSPEPFNVNANAFYYRIEDINDNSIYERATLYVPHGSKEAYQAVAPWSEFQNIVEMDLAPIDNGANVNIGTEINSDTNLDGNVVGNILYIISSGNGEFDPENGCIVVSKPVSDETMNNLVGKDIFGEDFKDQYTGIVFKVAEGKGEIKVMAQTTGNMVLKIKIGNGDPIEKVLGDKQEITFPYNVTEETLVYIYGSTKAAQAKRKMKGLTNTESGTLKIFGIEITSEGTGIQNITLDEGPQDVYSLSGQKVRSQAKDLKGLPAGVYIVGGKKIFVK